MISNHNEIETKLDATGVSVTKFAEWCQSQDPRDSREVMGPDYYYRMEDRVLRHRVQEKGKEASAGHHELTVKLRKSDRSTRDRLEIDLPFNTFSVKVEDVSGFVEAIGYRKEFVLTKIAHIFEYQRVIVAIYDVHQNDDARWYRFIEIEARKGEDITPDHAKKLVGAWTQKIAEQFGIENRPMNDSLYEFFSGRKYLKTPQSYVDPFQSPAKNVDLFNDLKMKPKKKKKKERSK